MRKPPSPREGLSRLNLCCQTPHYDGDDDDDDNCDDAIVRFFLSFTVPSYWSSSYGIGLPKPLKVQAVDLNSTI